MHCDALLLAGRGVRVGDWPTLPWLWRGIEGEVVRRDVVDMVFLGSLEDGEFSDTGHACGSCCDVLYVLVRSLK